MVFSRKNREIRMASIKNIANVALRATLIFSVNDES